METFALQHYEDRGFKGRVVVVSSPALFTDHTSLYYRFHCEGRIVTTLFGLLFWDVLFASIPGAFETPYQFAPLDLAEDTFYYSRQHLIDPRIAEIEAGNGAEILGRAYDENLGRMCVGVRWDLFEKEDLLGIVRVSLSPAHCTRHR